jgi:hypothetical protein
MVRKLYRGEADFVLIGNLENHEGFQFMYSSFSFVFFFFFLVFVFVFLLVGGFCF